MKEQTRNTEVQKKKKNERKIDKLPEKEFRIMIVKMIKTLESKHLYKLTFLCLCRYYGLSVWFPDVIKHLQSNVLKNVDEPKVKFSNATINFTMANQIITGMECDNGRSRNF